ncbi:MAG TPA: hypothetical protein VIW68_11755, partial [Candidatus Sulfotelmatobacter sp.]
MLKGLLAASTGMIVTSRQGTAQGEAHAPEQQIEIQVTPISAHTFRLSILPVINDSVVAIPLDGSLVQESWGAPVVTLRAEPKDTIVLGNLRLRISFRPIRITLATEHDEIIQQFAWDQTARVLSFRIGNSPIFGLGEGGPQFDRRGSTDPMRSGQGGYQLATHGGRVPLPWIVGTSGWGIFFHQPHGMFDFTGLQGKFQPADAGSALPLDLFVVASADPATIMTEYARITGYAEMPPLWSFGYQQ